MPRNNPPLNLPKNGTIPIHLTPKASRNCIEGWVKDAAGKEWLKVRITAVPEDGKANKALVAFLAKQLRLPASHLVITSGYTSRYKRIKIGT